MVWLWAGFLLFVVLMLALDLGIFHRKAHVVSVKEALIWSAVWVALSLAFTGVVYLVYETHWDGIGLYPDGKPGPAYLYPDNGADAVISYISGYLTEKSLSVDNVFVIALVFGTFGIPDRYQHRVLFWGILGAVVLRGIFILVGAELIARFVWVIYVFGVFLIFTAIRLLFAGGEHDPNKSLIVKLSYKYLPVTDTLHGQKFYIHRDELAAGEHLHEEPASDDAKNEAPQKVAAPTGASPSRTAAYILTPLGLSLIVVEFTDLIFAVDSIPAIFGITADTFLVFTSNIFAILGLRALYFALAGVIREFRYLQPALALVLGYIGVKMLVGHWLHDAAPDIAKLLPWITLGVITVAITTGIVASILFPGEEEKEADRADRERQNKLAAETPGRPM
jgi:tellurite resistance protein TerC